MRFSMICLLYFSIVMPYWPDRLHFNTVASLQNKVIFLNNYDANEPIPFFTSYVMWSEYLQSIYVTNQ